MHGLMAGLRLEDGNGSNTGALPQGYDGTSGKVKAPLCCDKDCKLKVETRAACGMHPSLFCSPESTRSCDFKKQRAAECHRSYKS